MKEEVQNWVDYAHEDLRMAELALKDKIYNQVCFHSQQCVEKILKGLIEFKGQIHPQTHKLADLFSYLPENPFEDMRDNILLLDRFYIPTRYPDALPGRVREGLPKERDAEEAIEVARAIFERARKVMGF
jgi:HEPN domain-containing protein